MRNDNIEFEIKKYPERKQKLVIQQSKLKPSNCLSCRNINWLVFDQGLYCQKFEFLFRKQKHQLHKKTLRQD